MKKKLFFLMLSLKGIHCKSAPCCSNSGIQKVEVPEYQTYQGIEINAESIGSLLIPLSKSHDAHVKEWRDKNKDLLACLLDFSYKNSDWETVYKANLEKLKKETIENKSEYNYIFSLPTDKDLFVQIAGPKHRIRNLQQKEGICDTELQSLETDALKKCSTFQTLSRYAHYLCFYKIAKINNFTNFKVPATYLIPLHDNQPTTGYCDDNCFVIQERIPENCVVVRENKERLSNVNLQSFKELLTAIAPAALWDIEPNLLIDDENNLVLGDIEQGYNTNPDDFFQKNIYMFNHLTCCGFKGLYNLCDQHPDLQHQIRDFIRTNVQLIEDQHSDEQLKELKNHLHILGE
jgi:hypothetical protein